MTDRLKNRFRTWLASPPCSRMTVTRSVVRASWRKKLRARNPQSGRRSSPTSLRATPVRDATCQSDPDLRSRPPGRGFTAKKEWVRRLFCALTHPIASLSATAGPPLRSHPRTRPDQRYRSHIDPVRVSCSKPGCAERMAITDLDLLENSLGGPGQWVSRQIRNRGVQSHSYSWIAMAFQ